MSMNGLGALCASFIILKREKSEKKGYVTTLSVVTVVVIVVNICKMKTSDHQAADFHLPLFAGLQSGNMTHIAKPRTPSSATPNPNLYLGRKLGNNGKAQMTYLG